TLLQMWQPLPGSPPASCWPGRFNPAWRRSGITPPAQMKWTATGKTKCGSLPPTRCEVTYGLYNVRRIYRCRISKVGSMDGGPSCPQCCDDCQRGGRAERAV